MDKQEEFYLQIYLRFYIDVFLFEKFRFLQSQVNVSIENSKQKCYSVVSSKLANPTTSSKKYWIILKAFLNNKEIPSISPLFHEMITSFYNKLSGES